MTPQIRRSVALFVAAIVAAIALQTGATAQGQRYNDEVFSSVEVTSDIAYGQPPDANGTPVTLLLDLYQPAGGTEASRPAFVWVHGGGFTGGSKAGPPGSTICDHLAKSGYVCVSIDYRLRPGEYFGEGDPDVAGPILDAQHDAQAAVRWLRANASDYGIDAERIGIGGTSAGAVTSLQVGYNTSDPGESGNPGYPSTVSAVVDVSGAMAPGLIDAGEPPVLIIHGTVDTRVAYQNALNIDARARQVGVPVEFHSIEGAGHGLWNAGYTDQMIAWMSDFLYRYLAPEPASSGGAQAEDASASGNSTMRNVLIAAAVAGVLVVLLGGARGMCKCYSVRRR